MGGVHTRGARVGVFKRVWSVKICCHNTQFAENSGFFQTVDLFGNLEELA